MNHEEAWAAEIDRRVCQLRNGTARLVSSDDMFKEALERLRDELENDGTAVDHGNPRQSPGGGRGDVSDEPGRTGR